MSDPVSPGSRRAPVADAALVAGLLRDQHPDLAELPLRRGPAGWDNVHWLLGDALAVRLPRRPLAAELVRHEARWVPVLAPHLPVAVPAPVRTGVPGRGFPWYWNVVPWLAGERLDTAGEPTPAIVDDLAAFLRALHVPAPGEAPHNPYRSTPLEGRTAAFAVAMGELRRWERSGRLPDGCGPADLDAIQSAVTDGLAAPATPGGSWLHADLHPGNVLVDAGRITAVVDWGDVCAGHREADLAVRWWAVPPALHGRFVAGLPDVDDATWRRSAGWAASIAAFLLTQASRAGDDALLAVALHTARSLAAAPPVP